MLVLWNETALNSVASDVLELTVADPRGGEGPGPPPPVKTSQKKDGHHAGPQVS